MVAQLSRPKSTRLGMGKKAKKEKKEPPPPEVEEKKEENEPKKEEEEPPTVEVEEVHTTEKSDDEPAEASPPAAEEDVPPPTEEAPTLEKLPKVPKKDKSIPKPNVKIVASFAGQNIELDSDSKNLAKTPSGDRFHVS